jgi:methylmalonyl-CoA mutase
MTSIEFPPVSKAEWLRQIEKDLKGRPLDALYWQLTPDLRIDPFGHIDDWPVSPVPQVAMPAGWEIGEDIDAGHPDAAEHIQTALLGGAEGLRFIFSAPYRIGELAHLLEGIYIDYIGLHFAGPGLTEAPGAFLAELARIAADKGVSTGSLRGSLAYDPANTAVASLTDWRYAADLMPYVQATFPGFRLFTIDGCPAYRGAAQVVDELADLLQRGRMYLTKLGERGIDPADTAARLQFTIAIGTNYFVEMAKLRAFRILWLNLMREAGAAPEWPCIDAVFHPSAYSDILFTNQVRATTMAMSAILGGAQRLTVRPYDADREAQATYPPALGRRIARNVQHLLKMESALDQTADPAAGSYFIEKLTAQIAEAVWTKMTIPFSQ